MSPTGAQGQAWGRRGGKGFRVAPRPLHPEEQRLGRTDTVGIVLDYYQRKCTTHSDEDLNEYQHVFKLMTKAEEIFIFLCKPSSFVTYSKS